MRIKSRRPQAGILAPKLQLKVYPYKFQLPAQYLTSNGSLGELVLSTSAGQAPITSSKFAIYGSQNGLPNFYDVGLGTNFQLLHALNGATFAGLYDAYKMGRVTCKITYLNNVSAVNTPGLLPTVYMYFDQDDAVIPPTLASISGKQGVKIRQFGDRSKTSHSITIQPVPAQVLQSVSGLASSGVGKPQWLDCGNRDVAHNALKIFITDLYLPAGTVTQALRFNFTYNIGFRSPLLTT
jgi:hypothetical protein